MSLSYRERYARVKDTDKEKNAILEGLLDDNDRLKADLAKTRDRLERDSDTVELYQQRSKDANAKFETLQKLADSNSYICVLIDGDCMNFRDSLVKAAASGGQEAAQVLRSAITDYAKGRTLGLRQDVEIIVYIYANVYGLMKAYRDAQILHEPSALDRFISGFNKSYPLLNFIDSGSGKEASDNKIREVFKLNANNIHCKHLIFGGSSDNGYARLLDNYVGNSSTKGQITLLEGPPFAKELARMLGNFKTTTFPRVFRDSKIIIPLQNGSSASHSTPAFQQAPPKHGISVAHSVDAAHSTSTSHSTSANQFLNSLGPPQVPDPATRASKGSEPPTRIAYPPEYFTDAPSGFIARNRKGQRVDVPLTAPPSGLVHEIRKRKLCNDFCLRGSCRTPFCQHEHARHLSQEEVHALRHVARSFPCVAGLHCNDKECYQGHRCPVDPCRYVREGTCRYPPELHDTDTGILNKEDLDYLDRIIPDDNRILGAAHGTATARELRSPIEPRRNSRGEPLFRNNSVTFNTHSSDKDAPRHKDLQEFLPSPIQASSSHQQNILPLSTDSANPGPSMVLDEYDPRQGSDPRLGPLNNSTVPQKRLREDSE